MELRRFAEQVLFSDTLDAKLVRVSEAFTDAEPGEPLRPLEPARPENLRFAAPRTAPAMPSPQAFRDPAKVAVAHHIMANHELQALEVMAFVLVAFPEAPADFRLGLAAIMQDEQQHTRMHAARAETLGTPFGGLPVNCYIWKKAQEFGSPLEYLAGLPLVFENRNLDHSLEFRDAFSAVGDTRSATLMQRIHDDEIEHVRFGLEWLRHFKDDDETDWDAYERSLTFPLAPGKAVGKTFHAGPREAAGMSPEFLAQLRRAGETTGNPGRR